MRLDVKVGQKVLIEPSWRWSRIRQPFKDTVVGVTFRSIKTTKMTFKRSNGIEWGQTARHGWSINTREINLITNEEALENNG